jgi:hypothetical protein
MIGNSVEEARRRKEQAARNKIDLEKSRAAAAAERRKLFEFGQFYIPPPKKQLAVPAPLAVPPPLPPRQMPAAAPVLARVSAPVSTSSPASYDHGLSDAAITCILHSISCFNSYIHDSYTHDKSLQVTDVENEIYMLYKKAINTILWKKHNNKIYFRRQFGGTCVYRSLLFIFIYI